MGLHFQDWIDYYGVAFSRRHWQLWGCIFTTELTIMGCIFSTGLTITGLHFNSFKNGITCFRDFRGKKTLVGGD